MMHAHAPLVALALCGLLACGNTPTAAPTETPPTPSDAGPSDAGPSDAAPSDAAPVATRVQASDGRVRAVPPGSPSSAAFLTLTSTADHPVALVGASSPAARAVELHTHVQADGMMQMRRVDRFELPAGGTLRLGSGGPHIMLIGLQTDLVAGATVPLTLRFDDGSELNLDLPVEPAGAASTHP